MPPWSGGLKGSPAARARPRPSVTNVVLALVLVVGVSASAMGALSWRDTVQTENQQAFNATATSVAGTLAASLKSYADALATEQTLIATNPSIGNAAFSQWFTSIDSVHRFPAMFGFVYIRSVTPAELPSFVNEVTADPSLGMSFPYQGHLNPPGLRPQYCLMRLVTLQVAPEIPIKPSQVPGVIGLFSGYVNPWNDECEGPEAADLRESAQDR